MVIAIIGASRDRHKFGNKALRAWRQQGHTVVPIHRTATEVEGERAYASVLDYPGNVDEATVYVPASEGLKVVGEIAEKGIPVVWLNPGADDADVVARAKQLGLDTRVACSIIGAGARPGDF